MFKSGECDGLTVFHRNKGDKMSKYKLVEVMRGDDWIPRNAILFNSNGSLLVIDGIDKQLDDEYEAEYSIYYPQWREIKEPTWKPFPDNESMGHLKDCWFRFKDNTRQFRTEKYDPDHYNVFYILGKWWSKEDLFEKAEVLTNGKWQPVGVLDNIQKQD